MNQNERWLTKYNEIMDFMAENHRRPSKYTPEERNNWNWWSFNDRRFEMLLSLHVHFLGARKRILKTILYV